MKRSTELIIAENAIVQLGYIRSALKKYQIAEQKQLAKVKKLIEESTDLEIKSLIIKI